MLRLISLDLLYPLPLYRPGIIDLPLAGRAENPDALVLPEVFHDFDDNTAEMGYVTTIFIFHFFFTCLLFRVCFFPLGFWRHSLLSTPAACQRSIFLMITPQVNSSPPACTVLSVYFGTSLLAVAACGGLFAVGGGAFMGGGFEAFDVRDGDFGGGMQDIEFERLATSADFNVEGSLNKGKSYKV